ncbi:aminoglycoside phosphotransferase family protein [Streptomyces sp. NBC_01381]|uniref:aminoglycoside phosphotransferase family protein n=1 Tax=Streptomyces sp. NBC_01381 TaxID=2903845 RepID=UPI0022563CE1|nr:aminoglycoside phosphotransferase family protein [Streptomyces sp. NBC_01381]MCX4667467.1 aminoglycoside phosphotransferase family protein [Streptomyces sp. NBC_01381]
MPPAKMHADEADIDAALVRRLLAAQFPRWASLTVTPVESNGTVNAIYRIGDDMAVRLPRVAGGVDDVRTEVEHLPRLAERVPFAVPAPLGKGEPGDGYPWPWYVYRWLDGANPLIGGVAEPKLLAADLARFVTALHRVEPTGLPTAYRPGPLAPRDRDTRDAIAQLDGVIDTGAAAAAWDAALRAPEWAGPPVWVHADLQPGNLLTTGGRLSAVIDFGCMGIGEPAVDLITAWSLLTGEARKEFRAALDVDDATWARGRGWALSIALIELPYYRTRNETIASTARHVIEEVLADHAAEKTEKL